MLGADIISISAAFFNKIDGLDLEISRAMRAGTVVIASTAGEGYNQANAFPADYDLVLKIAATTDMGKEAQESVKRNADFLFPGQNLVAETTFLGSDHWPHEVSGASVATAIAAGVASVVLACHRLALSTRTAKDRWERHNHFKREIVIKAFKEMWDEDASWGEAGSILAWIRDKYEELDRS
ncbi:Halolysin [Metarhizium anisopliae]|nr:Halolysin [Metarhizium anisopliae]